MCAVCIGFDPVIRSLALCLGHFHLLLPHSGRVVVTHTRTLVANIDRERGREILHKRRCARRVHPDKENLSERWRDILLPILFAG